jgi:hypothetical protein
MGSTVDNNLRLDVPDVDADENTWGAMLNTLISELQRSITDIVDIPLTSSNHTLVTTGAVDEEARKLFLSATGALVANVEIIAPLEPKMYIVRNGTTDGGGGPYTVGMNTPTGTLPLDIPAGETLLVYCDPALDAGKGAFLTINADTSGTVAQATNALNLVGIAGALYARTNVKNTFPEPQVVAADIRTLTADAYTPSTVTDAKVIIQQSEIPAGGTVTINNPSPASPTDGYTLIFVIEQHATTPASVAWGTNYIFPDDANLDLTQTANKVDLFSFMYNFSLDRWMNVGASLNLPRA